MKKLFISQPMGGILKDRVLEERRKAKEYVESVIGEKVEIIDSYFDCAPSTKYKSRAPVWCLGESIKLMADADIICFMPNWDKARAV